MQNKRWWRPLLAFLITFGALAMVGSVVRVVAVYQHFFALGMRPDEPAFAEAAARELARMDRLYTPVFLLAATGVSALAAGAFAWWRPRRAPGEPPPLPDARRAETR